MSNPQNDLSPPPPVSTVGLPKARSGAGNEWRIDGYATPADEREMFGLQNELLADWYDDVARRGVEYQPKPTGAQAFPSAADRQALDEIVPGGGIPPIGEPAGEQ